jgi:hypothetical protein
MPETRKVISSLIIRVLEEKPDHEFSKTQLQKILFRLQRSFPQDDAIHEILPYYWYRYGPFSPNVADAIEVMHNEGVLELTKYRKYRLQGVNWARNGDLERRWLNSLKSILKGFNSYQSDDFFEMIYKEAPSKFQHLFVYRFLTPFKIYLEHKKDAQVTFFDLAEEQLEESAYESEREIPRIPLFEEYKTLFASFVTDLAIVLDSSKKRTNIKMLEETKKVADIAWATFVDGIRIQKEAHDPYFDKSVSDWQVKFNESLSTLSSVLDEYTLHVMENDCLDDSCEDFDEDERTIIASIVDGYFSSEGFIK